MFLELSSEKLRPSQRHLLRQNNKDRSSTNDKSEDLLASFPAATATELGDLLEEATGKLESLRNRIQSARHNYTDLLAYFCEDPALDPQEFFSVCVCARARMRVPV